MKKKKLQIFILGVIVVLIAILFLKPKYDLYVQTRDWERIKTEFAKCNVKYTLQLHDLTAGVQLKDGTSISTKAPQLDDVWHLVDEAEKKCGEKPIFIVE